MTGPIGDWDSAYRREAPPPWDIGRPQSAFIAFAENGALRGDLLDAGCGTGEHTLLATSKGAVALGVDLSSTAIARARAKAQDRGLPARFEVRDILTMSLAVPLFDTVLDSGLFHVFDDADRVRYVTALGEALRDGGSLYLMCFSDAQPGDWGPRRVRRNELAIAFSQGWEIESIEADSFEINPMMGTTTAMAWQAVIRRTMATRPTRDRATAR